MQRIVPTAGSGGSPAGRRRGRSLAALALAAVAWASGARAAPEAGEADRVREYDVKAVFLFNFCQFVEWPSNALAAADAPIVIGILGADPFGPVLDQTVRDETIRGRRLTVRRFRRVEEVAGCHLLFVSRSETPRLAPVLRRLQGRGILTVGEAEGFIDGGGAINFVRLQKSVRFEINAAAAEKEGIRISAKLLKVARAAPEEGAATP